MPRNEVKKPRLPDAIIVKKMRDYSKEPAFLKQAEEAKEFLKKHGLYDQLTKKIKFDRRK